MMDTTNPFLAAILASVGPQIQQQMLAASRQNGGGMPSQMLNYRGPGPVGPPTSPPLVTGINPHAALPSYARMGGPGPVRGQY